MPPRLYESKCVYCSAHAVLNRFCRQCETHQPIPVDEIKNAPKNESDVTKFDFHECDTKLDLKSDSPNRAE